MNSKVKLPREDEILAAVLNYGDAVQLGERSGVSPQMWNNWQRPAPGK